MRADCSQACLTDAMSHEYLHCDPGMRWGHRKVLRMLDLKFETQIANDKFRDIARLTHDTTYNII